MSGTVTRRKPGVNREIVLRALRAAGDEGCMRADLGKALGGEQNPAPYVRQLRRGGHRIEARTENLGPPFNVQTVRYVLVADATPALFDE